MTANHAPTRKRLRRSFSRALAQKAALRLETQAAGARARRAKLKAAWEAKWLAGPEKRATVEGWVATEAVEKLLARRKS